MILWSFFVVLSGYFFLTHPIVNAFHVANPTFYINVYDDEMTSENFESKPQENYSNLGSDTTIKLQSKESPLKADDSKTNEDLKSSWPSKNTDSGIPTKLKTKENAPAPDEKFKSLGTFKQDIQDLELEKIEFIITTTEKPATEKTCAVSSEFSMAESSDDISMQFTRIYLKAITSLIQHIMDALFSVNDSVSEKRSSEMAKYDYSHALSPSRRLIKRDIQKTEPDSASSIAASNIDETTQNIHSSTDKDSGADKGSDLKIESSAEDSESKLHEKSPSSQQEPDFSTYSSIPNSKIDYPNLLEKFNENKKNENSENYRPESLLHVKDDNIAIKDHTHTTDHPHVAFVVSDRSTISSHKSGVADFTDTARMKEKLIKEKKHTKHEVQDYMVSIDGLRDQDSDLMTYTKNEQDSADFEGKYKIGHQPSEDGYVQKVSSGSGTILVMSGIVMIVIIFASAGAAVAYTLRKRSFNQSGNQHAQTQRPIVA